MLDTMLDNGRRDRDAVKETTAFLTRRVIRGYSGITWLTTVFLTAAITFGHSWIAW